MKSFPLVVATGVVVALGACGSTSSYEGHDFAKPGEIMAQEINERINRIQYQRKEELISNLVWLKEAGEQAIPALSRALGHRVPKVRSSAAWVLGAMGDKRSIQFLRQHQSDSSPVVRLEVARAMLLLGDYEGVNELINGLESEHSHVRFLCYSALHSATGKEFGYDIQGEDAVARRASVDQWRDWWKKQSTDPMFNGGALAAPNK